MRVTVGDSGLCTFGGVYVLGKCSCQVRVTVGDSGLCTFGGVYVPSVYSYAR